jgi:ribosomal protein S18 acetylase RimI-like enzyme
MVKGPGIAELSIAVRDDFQNAGIGSALLTYVAKQARAHGIRTLVATFNTSNRAIWSLLRRTPYRYRTEVHGPEVSLEIYLRQRKRRVPVAPDRKSPAID